MKTNLKIWQRLERRPDIWCKKSLAKDSDNHAVPPRSRKAVAWCAAGLIRKFIPEIYWKDADDRLGNVVGRWSLEAWNDSQRSVKPIIAAFKKAGL